MLNRSNQARVRGTFAPLANRLPLVFITEILIQGQPRVTLRSTLTRDSRVNECADGISRLDVPFDDPVGPAVLHHGQSLTKVPADGFEMLRVKVQSGQRALIASAETALHRVAPVRVREEASFKNDERVRAGEIESEIPSTKVHRECRYE